MHDSPMLRVVYPDEQTPPPSRAAGELSAEMTLVEFFWRYVWPDCLAPKGDSKRTRKDYAKSLDYWKQFTGNPPLAKISKRTCSKFVNLLGGLAGQKPGEPISANTVRKHWDNVQRLLQRAGPENRQNPDGAGLLENPPWLQPPRRHFRRADDGFSLSEIHEWLEACAEARSTRMIPGDVPAEVWWPALIQFDYNTGLRLDSLMRARWEMIDGNWLEVPPTSIKCEQGQRLWLNQWAVQAIESLPHRSGLIFPWHGWPQTHNTLQSQRRWLQGKAGIRCRGFKALRRTFATQLAKISAIAAQIMMNHKGLGMEMLINHYLDAESMLSEALARLPQPGRAVQQTLF